MIKVIVIDDETDIFPLFKIKFKREIASDKIKFTFFTTAEESLAFIKDHRPDAFNYIITDINMPGMSGLEFLKEIKQTNDSQKVIMLSADKKSNYQEEADRLGAEDYMNKPVDFDKLRAIFFN